MEVTNRFKGLDLIDRVPEELQTEVHDIVQEAAIKTIPKKKKCKKAAVDASHGESKFQCCKEQYCIGTWNLRVHESR